MVKIIIGFLLSFSLLSAARAQDSNEILKTDLQRILKQAEFVKTDWDLQWQESSDGNNFKIICGDKPQVRWSSSVAEKNSTFYYGLRQLGFLFPHPRWQISPAEKEAYRHCGKNFEWRPRLKDRGFHLHLQHPSEWVDGFYMDNTRIAEEMIFWLARNQQNILQLQLLKTIRQPQWYQIKKLIQLAHGLGIKVGASVSFAMIQQKSYSLIPLWRSLTGWGDEEALKQNLENLLSLAPFDYVAVELGQTEFTATDYERTIRWLNQSSEILKSQGKFLLAKVHVSINQNRKDFGNFNFIPQFAHKDVGVEPHTVFFYALEDNLTPMYGRSDFKDMKEFMAAQNGVRRTWYYPETSYFVGMDIDVPLFLTDYLVARTVDMDLLETEGVTGQVNFSTGQELGYWLFDWQVALAVDPQCRHNAMCALELLKEDLGVWGSIISWQTEHIKKGQIIQMISASNLMDELPRLFDKVHSRVLLRDLAAKPLVLEKEIEDLKKAFESRPSLEKVSNKELKILLEVTYLRVQHALLIRQALKAHQENDPIEFEKKLAEAVITRNDAQLSLKNFLVEYQRYPESFVFDEKDNPTSYGYGYGWPAKTLHFWRREEEMIRKQNWNPFFMNIYNPVKLIF